MTEIINADEIQQKREALHSALKEKVKNLCAEARKLGCQYGFSAQVDGIGNIEAKNGKCTFLRVGNTYYVSEYDTPTADALIKGVQVLRALIDVFNAKAQEQKAKLANTNDAIAELKINEV